VTQELNLGRWVGLGRTQSIRSQGRACFDVPQGKSVFCVTLCEVPTESRSPGLSRTGGLLTMLFFGFVNGWWPLRREQGGVTS